MSFPPDFKLTTELLLRGALVFALLDLAFTPFLAWRIPPERFRELKWIFSGVAAIFWASLWAWVLDWGWTPVYSYVFPPWLREWLPLLQAIHFALVAYLFLWIAQKQRFPVVALIVLGGLWGIVTHTWAVLLGIVTKPPMLQGSSPLAAVTIAAFEFAFYWCVILSASALGQALWQKAKRMMSKPIHLALNT